MAPDYPNTYWISTNDSRRQGEKFALIREILDAMPRLDMMRQLHGIFVTRCHGPLGNTVHTPTFMRQAEALYNCLSLASLEAGAITIANTFPMDTLAYHLLALVIALAFHPNPAILGWSPTPLSLEVEELRASGVAAKVWRSLALRCLQGGISLFCGSITSLQAAIMLLLDGQEESLVLDTILVTAISGAQKLGLHRLGDAKLEVSALPASFAADESSALREPFYIRTEVGVRIW